MKQHHKIWTVVVLIINLLIAISISWYQVVAKETVLPLDYRLTSTLTPTPTITPTPVTNSLKSQLQFGLGGAGGAPLALDCREAVKKYLGKQGAIFAGKRNYYGALVAPLCIYGVNIKNELKIDITDRKENKVGSATFILSNPATEYAGYQGFELKQVSPEKIESAGELVYLPQGTLIEIYLWLPPDIANGDWSMRVKGDILIKGKFNAEWPTSIPVIYYPHKKANPFTRPKDVFNVEIKVGETYNLANGEEVTIKGKNIPANRTFQLAFYLNKMYEDKFGSFPDDLFNLVRSQTIKSDAQGNISQKIRMQPDDPKGNYLLLLMIHPDGFHIDDVGPYLYIRRDG